MISISVIPTGIAAARQALLISSAGVTMKRLLAGIVEGGMQDQQPASASGAIDRHRLEKRPRRGGPT